MKTAIVLHGMPSKKKYYDPSRSSESNGHWLPWLQHELIIRDILAQTPEMPKPYEPNYENWLNVFKQFTIDEDTIVIGHSCGGGFLVRWLSENEVKVGKVVLVAPWIDPGNIEAGDFFKFNIDSSLVDKTNGVTIFVSDDDDKVIHESAKMILDSAPGVNYREFHNYGHFCYSDMKTREFPELLEEALK